MNLPHKVGDRYRCFIVERADRGYGGPYGQTHRPAVWRCEDCSYLLKGDMVAWQRKRAADHHECGHAPCALCGAMLARRKDGSSRQHAHNRCQEKTPGHRIEREFVKNIITKEYQ